MELDSGVGGEKTEGEGALQAEDGAGQRKSRMQKTIQISLRLNICLQIYSAAFCCAPHRVSNVYVYYKVIYYAVVGEGG
jgi:hypothetical protein